MVHLSGGIVATGLVALLAHSPAVMAKSSNAKRKQYIMLLWLQD
jgi:hypothetical protein